MFKLKNLLQNISIMGICTIISRIGGYIREILLSSWLGTSCITDALIIATRIPTLLRKIAMEGSINAVLFPLMVENKENKNKVNILINQIFFIFLSFFILYFLFSVYFSRSIVSILSPGTLNSPLRLEWFLKFAPFMSATIFFVFLIGMFNALLNFNNLFFWPAIGPAIWNFVLIILISIAYQCNLSEFFIGPIFLTAIIVHTLVIFYYYRLLKIPFILSFTKESRPLLKTFFFNFFHFVISGSIAQINTMLSIFMTSYLPSGNTTLMHRANRILEIPNMLITIIVTPLLPELTKNIKQDSYILTTTLFIASCVFIPVAGIFYFFGTQLVNIIFNYGKMEQAHLEIIAAIVKLYAYCIPALALNKILSIFFFAKNEIKAPTYAAIFCSIVNMIGNITFFTHGLMGFVMSTIISVYAQLLFLVCCIKKII